MNNPSTCPHFPLCSGCELTAIYNPPIWREALLFFRSLSIEPTWETKSFSQTRYKAKLAVRAGAKGEPLIGLFKKNSHEVLPIPHCLVHHASINRAVAILQEEMARQKISAYQENPPSGHLRYLQLFVERSTGKVQLTLVATRDLTPFCQSLARYDLFHSIWLNLHPLPTNRILGDTWKRITGEPYLWQTLNGTPLAFHPGAFSQAHLPLFERMLQQIETYVRPTDRVLELYAGVGAIGLNLHSKARHLTLIENNPYAHLSYQQNPKANIDYLCEDAEKAPLPPADLLIVDPPRKGLSPPLLPRLQADRMIYISCGFDSFQRDCLELMNRGWKIKEAQGYLLFPGTNQIETVALFDSL